MKRSSGFTLVELMIVVGIVAFLAAVAYPAYTNYVIRGKLAEGQAALSQGRIRMEQFFQDNRTYVGGPTPAATTNFTFSHDPAATATGYTLKATGIAGATGFVYSIDQTNTKRTHQAPSGWSAAGMPATPVTCWIS